MRRHLGSSFRALVLTGTAMIVALLPGTAFAALPTDPTAARPCGPSIERQLRALVGDTARDPIPGVILDVRGPGLRFADAAGKFAVGGRALRVGDTFRTASVTKTVTAATVLRLAEQRRLDLDASIGRYLDPALVERVHVLGGVDYGARITVRQLLDHSAGLYDYATDPTWQAEVRADPGRTWTPAELVDHAITHGTPYFPPGTGSHYSDTGYVLAGFVIERVTGKPLHRVYRDLVLDPLGMRDTYLEHWEHPRGGPLSHAYIGDVDTRDFNPTFDTFGGGGLVATSADLTRFVRGLFEGRLFRDPHTLATMLTTGPDRQLALGIFRFEVRGREVWLHQGFFGAFQAYLPDRRISVTGTINQATADSLPLLVSAFDIALGTRTPPGHCGT